MRTSVSQSVGLFLNEPPVDKNGMKSRNEIGRSLCREIDCISISMMLQLGCLVAYLLLYCTVVESSPAVAVAASANGRVVFSCRSLCPLQEKENKKRLFRPAPQKKELCVGIDCVV